ncbi:hypothetical protein BH11PSE4_BH11PSE4_25110 [soil metagenome]
MADEAGFMNKIAALISAGVGGAFFSLQVMFPQQMLGLVSGVWLDDYMAGDHARARSAVYKVLIDPQSAAFQDLRTVEAAKAKFVCGKVNSKDKSGVYAGYRAFVYERAGDMVRIDDDGRILKVPASFSACPVPQDAVPAAKPITISAETMEMAGKILKVLPSVDVQAVPPAAAVALGALGGSAGTGGSPASLQSGVQALAQSVPQLERKPGQGAGNVQSPAKPAAEAHRDNERDWRGDRPPAAWPVFTADDPLAKPASKRSNADTMALAVEVEQRWSKVEAGRSKAKPSRTETREALRALLAIDPASKEFPQAWSLFVRLRKIDRGSGPKES